MYRLREFSVTGIAALAALSFSSSVAEGQYLGGGSKNGAETQLADLQEMGAKFASLGAAFPDSLYDWRPMEGVRSVRDVMALIAAECALFPTMWGYDAPGWAAPEGGFGPELARLAELSPADLRAEVERGFAHVTALVAGMSAGDRSRRVNFFGLDVDLATAVTLMANDMHEHLGQSIAYARMNRIVPPWSR